jgi:inner membrane protein
MDNLTHSVVGLAVGELLQRSLAPEPDPARQAVRRRLLLAGCWAASNFPDLDIVLKPLLPDPLGYLLHHRGHTHTLLGAIPQALLLIALIWLLWPAARTLLRQSAGARRGLLAALGIGLLLHLAMDYLNSYGVHPFHPFDSHWLYGDMLFIVEPLFWIGFGVPLAMMVASRARRWLLLGLLIGAPLLFTASGYLHWGSMAALLAVALGLGTLERREHGRRALACAFALSLAFVGVQDWASAHGKRLLAAQLASIDPASRVLDLSMTAFPSNPLCWSFVSVERDDSAGSYRLRRGVLSLATNLMPAAACPPSLARPQSQQALTPAIGLLYEDQVSLAALRRLAQGNCYFRAWLRFARAPALSGQSATDVRFGAGSTANFTTIDLAAFEGRACPRHVPGWDFPRADLLAPAP